MDNLARRVKELEARGAIKATGPETEPCAMCGAPATVGYSGEDSATELAVCAECDAWGGSGGEVWRYRR